MRLSIVLSALPGMRIGHVHMYSKPLDDNEWVIGWRNMVNKRQTRVQA